MSKTDNNNSTLYCSFCGKSQHEVKKLIAGPTVFICDECVELCMDIIKEEHKQNSSKGSSGVPTPAEIFKVLDEYVIGQSSAKKFYLFLFITTTKDLTRQMGLMMLKYLNQIFC